MKLTKVVLFSAMLALPFMSIMSANALPPRETYTRTDATCPDKPWCESTDCTPGGQQLCSRMLCGEFFCGEDPRL